MLNYKWADVKQEIDDEFRVIMKDIARLEVWESFADLANENGLPTFLMNTDKDISCVVAFGVPQGHEAKDYARLRPMTDGTIEIRDFFNEKLISRQFFKPDEVITWLKTRIIIPAECVEPPTTGEKEITQTQLRLINPRAIMRLDERVFFFDCKIYVTDKSAIIARKDGSTLLWDDVADDWISITSQASV